MTTQTPHAEAPQPVPAKSGRSRWGTSLQRVVVGKPAPVAEPVTHSVAEWLARWGSRVDEISSRLALIDSHLDKYAHGNRSPDMPIVSEET